MFYLLDFEPIKPDIGLIFWTTIIFGLFWLIVGKFAFKPIASALRKREEDIQSSLDQAKFARTEMANLKAENEKLLAEAREERAKILKEAKDAGERIVQEAKQKAKDEAQKIVTGAKAEIESQTKQALIEVKNQVGNMALNVAEQVLRTKLKDDKQQQELVDKLVKEMKFN
jgi:F-type H+-transporting ATPase subunit b